MAMSWSFFQRTEGGDSIMSYSKSSCSHWHAVPKEDVLHEKERQKKAFVVLIVVTAGITSALRRRPRLAGGFRLRGLR